MEKKVNLVELLRHAPSGMELDCVLFDDSVKVIFDKVDETLGFVKIVVIRKNNRVAYSVTKYGQWDSLPYHKCVIFPKGKTTWEGFVPPCNFKDGDIVFSGVDLISIFKGLNSDKSLHSYVSTIHNGSICIDGNRWTSQNLRHATEEEKEKLFKAIKDNGYKWNADTNTLEKLIVPKFKVGDKVQHKNNHGVVFTITNINIEEDTYVCGAKAAFWFDDQDNYELVPNKFDITNLKPFDSRVLVREGKTDVWQPAFYGFFNQHNKRFYTTSTTWLMCIPYNEDTKHLVGTTNDCDDFYKTWE